MKDVDVEFIDVEDYEEQDKYIRSGVIYYSTGQVGKLLGENPSKIKYYCNFFNELLSSEKVNDRWQITEEDVDRLRFIIELKNKGMKLKQIRDYCSEVEFDENNKPVVKEDNPLSIQVLAQALLKQQEELIARQSEEFKNQIQIMKSEIIGEIKTYLDTQNQHNIDGFEVLKEDIEQKVGEVVGVKLDNVTNSINEIKENINTKYISREEIENYNKKKSGFFNRLFKG
ncbi:MerR family transcriptional regulator [Clostridium sp.]|uniref:MerR family transcriptional regulator n=1 Tax=Clostridium sp. TaxID=1506 RepID=UPI002638D54F|nr:MerR family transcriptional regulator [Clostridium sp.]